MIDHDALRDYIYENFNVPADNCTMAPGMLDAILEYSASEFSTGAQQMAFLSRMLPSLPEAELRRYDL